MCAAPATSVSLLSPQKAPWPPACVASRRSPTAARKLGNQLGELAKAAAAELKAPIEEVPGRLAQVLDERRRLERELAEARKKLALGGGARADTSDGVRVIGDVKLIARAVKASI
jgi:alanyl-tRNA synthetase